MKPCHIRATHGGRKRSAAATHGQTATHTSNDECAGQLARDLPNFQAGHEGSIPFARSNPKPQVSASIDLIATKIMMLSRARVPATIHLRTTALA
jgi:hypothetical protein